MSEKPELIVFSQNLMGGGSSFHRNMLENNSDNFFDIKCIYLDPLHWVAARSTDLILNKEDLIFSFDEEPEYETAKKLSKHISKRKGAIVANLPQELQCLNYYWKPKKTVYFICHDKGFLQLCKKYDYLIDIYIAHNHQVYEDILDQFPNRIKDIHFIQHGVKLQNFEKKINFKKNLNIVFLARHVMKKGLFDLPKIDDELQKNDVFVDWMILGDGQEREKFIDEVKNKTNFKFQRPKSTEEIINILKTQDIYILPSSHDGLPVSLLEAMSTGCVPVIYNFSDGIKKVVTPDIGNVLEVNDYLGMSQFIEKLNYDRELLHILSKNCIKKVSKDFDIKNQVKLYFDLYKDYEILKKKNFSLKKIKNKYLRFYGVRFLFRVLNKFKKLSK